MAILANDACHPPSNWKDCKPWDISEQESQNVFTDGLIQESLSIAGAKVNVYKLLGVHEQGKLIDLVGSGNPLSGGNRIGFPSTQAFTTFKDEWQSLQTGSAGILASSFIGYDFGIVKIQNGRQRYGIDASIRHHITTIRIKQSSSPTSRVTKARIERSEDGKQWYGVAIVDIPNNDTLNTIHFKNSVPNRYWRLRPLVFTGSAGDSWGVQALELHDYEATHISNIQDKVFLENRDRDYHSVISLKGFYDLLQPQTDLTRFGIDITASSTYNIRVNFNACISTLGRPIVIGDIIELPSETQYTPDLKPIKRWLEVTDVTWDSSSYTPGWLPTMLAITAQPAIASQETQNIFGDLAKKVDSSGLFDNDDGNHPMFQDYSEVDQTINQLAKTDVPERGSEGSNTVRQFSEEEIAAASKLTNLRKMNFNRTGLYVEDAMPQNGEPYTESSEFPLTPKDGDYHRLIYQGLAKDVPARLHRWSTVKGRWVYLETDRRAQYNNQKSVLDEYLISPTRISQEDIR